MYMNKLHMKATVAVVCLPRETVDNAGLSTKVAVDKVNDILVHFLGFLGNHGILQVGTVEALCEPKGEREREWEGRMGEEGKRGGRKGAEEGE